MQHRLRLEARRGNILAVTNFLKSASPDQLTRLLAADGATLLHHVCTGQPTKGIFAALIGWPYGVCPAPRDAERAGVLSAIVQACPRIVLFAGSFDSRGFSPIHLCVRTASTECLRVLVGALKRVVTSEMAGLLLAVPMPDGATAFDLSVASQQWEAASLLVCAAPLSHVGIKTASHLSMTSSMQHRASSTDVQTELDVVTGTIASTINKFWDVCGGSSSDGEVVVKHKRLIAATNPRGCDGEACSVHVYNRHAADNVSVLESYEEIALRRHEQINAVMRRTNVSEAEATRLLQRCCWDENQAVANFDHRSMPTQAARGSGFDWIPSPPGRTSISTTVTPSYHVQEDPSHLGLERTGACLRSTALKSNDGVFTASNRLGPCMICFEHLPFSHIDGPAMASMPCSDQHPVCDDCWRGILRAAMDEGRPNNAICPHQSCGLPLPLSSATQLLDREGETARYARLVMEHYVSTDLRLRFCPAVGCHRVLQRSDDGEGGATPRSLSSCASSAEASGATATRYGRDSKCTCGHEFCWNCNGSPHEPATCSQAASWRGQLERLRALAPELDQQWLRDNAKGCPTCGVFVQKNGGCIHMTCTRCGSHWCWECGRPWKEHSASTGGFYFCLFAAETDEGGSGSNKDASTSSSQQPNSRQNNKGSVSTSHGWLKTALQSLQGLASKATKQRALKQYLAHECDPVRLSLIAAHIMRLLQALERSGELRRGLANCSTLGIQLTDAARMPSGEWESLVLAASHSAIEHAQHNKKSTGPDCGLESTTNHAAPGLHPAVMQRDGVHAGCTQAPREHTSTIGRLNLPILIGAICKAHRLLQNASAVLFALPGGPRRRYLLELCDAVESSLQRLEALVLQLPFKDEAVSCARALAEIDVDATPHGQSGGGPIGGILGAVKWCIKAWHRVPDAPLHEGGFPGLSIEVLQAQAHFVVAVVQVWDESYASELERLLRSIHALKHAGLNGVFNN